MRFPYIFILLIFVGLTPASGCYRATKYKEPSNRDHERSLQFGGMKRNYIFHLPTSHDPKIASPLLIVFHGALMDGKGMRDATNLNDIADRRGFIVVYPDGYKRTWASGGMIFGAGREGVDDVGFVTTLIDNLSKELNIDLKRVYAAGLSNGGMFAHRLGCELSDRIAAIASVGGTMPTDISKSCKPKRPISVMIIHGTKDRLVRWEGGSRKEQTNGFLSVPATVNKWVEIDGCSAPPKHTVLADKFDDGTRIRREAYEKCKDKAEVILYVIEGGGHLWPNGFGKSKFLELLFGNISEEIDVGEVIWDFFQRHSITN